MIEDAATPAAAISAAVAVTVAVAVAVAIVDASAVNAGTKKSIILLLGLEALFAVMWQPLIALHYNQSMSLIRN